MRKILNKKTIFFILAILIILIIPLITNNGFLLFSAILTFIFAILGISWNMIGGYGGQISWCHSAFVTIGAYTSYILFRDFALSPWLTVFVGAGITFLVATLVGRATFRLRGPFFSISTLAFAEIVRITILYFKSYTGGASGIYLPYKESSFWHLTFQNNIPFYYIIFALLIAVIVFTIYFEKSKIGYYLGAIKGDEDAAISLGIKTFSIKLRTFQISAVIASIAGTFYGFFLTYIEPFSMTGLDLSVRIGTIAIIGGLGNLWGPVLGAFIMMPVIQLSSLYFGQYGGASQVLYGLIMIIIIIYRPEGIISLFKKYYKKIEKDKKKEEVAK